MKEAQVVYIGVDVSKATLSFNAGTLFIGDIENTTAKITAKLKELSKKAGPQVCLHVCFESTGPYGDTLFNACNKASVLASILNPWKVRLFAKAISETAKTDPIDARVIKLFAEIKKPSPTLPPSPTQTALRKLILVRNNFSKSVVQLGGVLDSVKNDPAGKLVKQTISYLEKKIAAIDLQIVEIVKKDERSRGLADALTQITGIGMLTAAKTLALVPELGTLGRQRAGALAGLVPYIRESGTFKGKAFISGGRFEVRRALYMPALTARQHNPILKAVYDRLIGNGKPYKVAMTAVMRRLFCHMDTVAADWIEKNPEVALAESSAKKTCPQAILTTTLSA